MFGDKLFTGVGFPTPVSIPDTTTCLIIQVPASDEWWALMVGVLYTLTLEWNWQQFEGGLDRDVAATRWEQMLYDALVIASTSNACDLDVPAPYWDEDSADDADDEGTITDQPWYGEIVAESNTWTEQVGIWAITAFIALTATPAAAIAFLPFANRFVLAFKQHSLGAIVKVLIDGVEMITVDTYAPTDGIINVPISLPAPAGFVAFDTSPVLWVMMTDEANPAVEGTPNMQVIRKRLDVSEVTPANLRWNEDCDCVQQSPDGGTTWVDNPSQDPRSSPIFQVPLRTGTDIRCNSAQQMHDKVKNMLDAIIASSDILQAINSVVGVIAVFFFEFGIVIEAIWAIVTAVFGIGTSALNAALTDAVYDQLLCIFYCNISGDGSVTPDQFTTIKGLVDSDIGGTAAFAINQMLDSIGNVGLTNAGALGEVTGDCSACDCGWCRTWLGGDGLGDWLVPYDILGHAGGSYNGGTDQIDGTSINEQNNEWASGQLLGALHVTEISISFDYVNEGGEGSDTSSLNTFIDGVRNFTTYTGGTGSSSFTWTGDQEASTSIGFVITGQVSVTITCIEVKGFGTPPASGRDCS